MLGMPRDRVSEASFEVGMLWLPAKFGGELGRVDRVAAVVHPFEAVSTIAVTPCLRILLRFILRAIRASSEPQKQFHLTKASTATPFCSVLLRL